MAKFTSKVIKKASELNLAVGADSYPEFEPGYDAYLAAGGINVEDFKVGFAIGFAAAAVVVTMDNVIKEHSNVTVR